MGNEGQERGGPAAGRDRLPARVFYTVIVAGVLFGVALSGSLAWAYLQAGDREPVGKRIWADIAGELVVFIAVMMGATFGGLAGAAAAVVLDVRSRRAAEPRLSR